MARIQSPPILSQIRVARNYSDQVASLRALKDEVVGHAQSKEKWVEQGVLEPLVKMLQTSGSPSRFTGKEGRNITGHQRVLTDAELVRLHALQLIASFANGGPAFLGPLHAVGAIPAILSAIFPYDNAPQIVVTALRALSNITDAVSLSVPASQSIESLAEILFVPRYLEAFCVILSTDSTAAVVQEQKCLVASLISRLCKQAHHQNALANAGTLDALATLLASFVVARGEVVPTAEILGEADGLTAMIPDPATQGIDLALVLEAISAIIADSRFRAYMLICSPSIMAVLPYAEFSPPAREHRATWNALEMSGLSYLGARKRGAMDYLLPVIPVTQPRSLSSHLTQFPPLGSSSRESLGQSTPTNRFSPWIPNKSDLAGSNDSEPDDPESPLIPWLIHLFRKTEGLERVMAASVLASLFKAGFTDPDRENYLGVLVVPPLCQLIKDSIKEQEKDLTGAQQNSSFVDSKTAVDWAILERTPAVLARLVADSEYLQQVAHDSDAMRNACKVLKDTYDPIYNQAPPRPWSPNPDKGVDSSEGLSTCRLGPPGQLPMCAHRIRLRESSLKLLAAMIIKDDYHRALIEQDIVPYIVESLSPSPSKPRSSKEKPKSDKKADETILPSGDSPYGNNPNSVIIAACHLIRILGRSVRDLRTSLEDHGVAMPILRLLRHPDAEVQIAACGAVCNLVTEVSPMRETLIEAGVIKILCEHAHSQDPGLRLNSMWALKHLVWAVENKIKKQCLEELESGWLVQLICADTEDDALHARAQNRAQDTDEDEDMDAETYDDDGRSWLWPAMYRMPCPPKFASLRSQSPRMQKAEKKLLALRDAEVNPTRKARNDDLAIQEQAINFIRNLMGQPTTNNIAEMVDYVFDEIGQEKLFEILAGKLRVRVLHPFARRYSTGRDTRVLYPQAKVIEAVIFMLVHIAASIPQHRQLVIAQRDLLKLLEQHFNSKDSGVRAALCHLLTNLVWQDDSADAAACGQRASELKRLGFLARLQALEQEDAELDVRERARAAVWQMKNGNA
ncbi:Armadillo-type fold [Naviculisporaceae sp. PSN 640]